MFGSIGGPEMVVILIIALLIFGPRRLPELGRSLGRGLAELRRASTDLRQTLEREIQAEATGKAESPGAPPGATPRLAPPRTGEPAGTEWETGPDPDAAADEATPTVPPSDR